MIISLSGRMGSGKDTAGSIILDLLTEHGTWHIKKWAGSLRKVAAILLGMDEEFLYTEEFKQMTLPEIWSTYYRLASNGELVGTITMEEYIKLPTESVKCIPMTGREFLQKLGTDAIRNGLHDNSWVNALIGKYRSLDKAVFHDGNYFSLCYQCNKQFIGHKRQLICKSCVDSLNKALPNWIITDTRFPNELQAVKERDGITICIKRDFQPEPGDTIAIKVFSNWSEAIYKRKDDEGYYYARDTGSIYTFKSKLIRPISLHLSEIALDKAEFDYIIDNNGTTEELKEKLILILKQHNLL